MHQVKDPVIASLWLGLLLWHGCHIWPGNLGIPQVQPKINKCKLWKSLQITVLGFQFKKDQKGGPDCAGLRLLVPDSYRQALGGILDQTKGCKGNCLNNGEKSEYGPDIG